MSVTCENDFLQDVESGRLRLNYEIEVMADAADRNFDELVDALKADVDRTLIRENLRLTPHERLVRLQELHRFAVEVRSAGERVRRQKR